MAQVASAMRTNFRQLVVLSILFYFHRSVWGEDIECTPGAFLAHSSDCSKYYVCDEDNNKNLFKCPSNLLYDPKTTRCELAEKVTCFEAEEDKKKEKTLLECADCKDAAEREERTEKRNTEKDRELHKEFYLVNDDSNESSKSEISKSDESEEEGYLKAVLSGSSYKKQDESETKENKEGDSEIKVLERTEKSDEPNESKTDQTKLAFDFTDEDDVVPIEKRESNTKKLAQTGDYPHVVEESKNIKTEIGVNKENVTQEKSSKIDVIVSTVEESSNKYILKHLNGTNLLYLGSSLEPVANWTEEITSNWTDLKIFWKHPTNEVFKGSVSFYYPGTTISDEIEIENLLINILSIGDKTEDEIKEERKGEYDGLDARKTYVQGINAKNDSEINYHYVNTSGTENKKINK